MHILCRFGKDVKVYELVRDLKRESAKWLKEDGSQLKPFRWQSGYGAFSISPSHVDPLTAYIADQEEHHRKLTFQDEFRRLCAKYGVELEERYAWE